MGGRFESKIVLVTGEASDPGKDAARAFAREGTLPGIRPVRDSS